MSYIDLIRRLSHPLEPMATDMAACLDPIDGVRAVLFDVYGTLLISASGDIGLTGPTNHDEAIREALAAAGFYAAGPTDDVVPALRAEIERQHASMPTANPEIDIREVWRQVLRRLRDHGRIAEPIDQGDVERLAVEYEMRVNPVWPMPGVAECLAAIRSAGLPMGIVSNAQFFTPLLFPALLDRRLAELGFSEDLCVWSYAHRQAKPGAFLYERAAEALASRGIAAEETLYAGNDLRNDVAPAAQVGFRTVLFAGDARSLRLREGDPLVVGITPDRVVTDVRQILSILRLAPM